MLFLLRASVHEVRRSELQSTCLTKIPFQPRWRQTARVGSLLSRPHTALLSGPGLALMIRGRDLQHVHHIHLSFYWQSIDMESNTILAITS